MNDVETQVTTLGVVIASKPTQPQLCSACCFLFEVHSYYYVMEVVGKIGKYSHQVEGVPYMEISHVLGF